MTISQIQMAKGITSDALEEAFLDWAARVEDIDPDIAWTCLVVFLAHVLAGAATSLGHDLTSDFIRRTSAEIEAKMREVAA